MNLLETMSYQEEMNYNTLNNANKIKRIDVSYGYIRSLPILPLQLEELCIDDNEDLLELPKQLPCNLRILSMCLTGIRSLDMMWPVTLQELHISDNPGINLTLFPQHLKIFSGNSCDFVSMPYFPNTIVHISIANNKLVYIPPLPPRVEYINIANNKIKSIPMMPNTVDTFICCNNEISSFKNISTNMKTFHCANNKIIRFPNLPHKLTLQQFQISFICWENPLIYDFNSAYNPVYFINRINHFVETYYSWKICSFFTRHFKPSSSTSISTTNNCKSITDSIVIDNDVSQCKKVDDSLHEWDWIEIDMEVDVLD
jgi:hypothetical protein